MRKIQYNNSTGLTGLSVFQSTNNLKKIRAVEQYQYQSPKNSEITSLGAFNFISISN